MLMAPASSCELAAPSIRLSSSGVAIPCLSKSWLNKSVKLSCIACSSKAPSNALSASSADTSADEILRVGEFSPAKVKKRKQIEEAQIRGAELQNMGRGVDLTIKHINLMKNMRLEDRGPYIESLGDSLTVNGFDHRVALESAVVTGKLEEYEASLRYLSSKAGLSSEMLDLLKSEGLRQNHEVIIAIANNFLDAEVKNVAAVDLAEKKAAIATKSKVRDQAALQAGILELERKKDAQKAKTPKPLSEAFKRKDIESLAARKSIEGMTRQEISEASEPTSGRTGRPNPKFIKNLEEIITKATRATADDKGSEAFEALYRRLVGREFIGDPTTKIQKTQETPPDETGVTNKNLFDKILGTLGLSGTDDAKPKEAKPKEAKPKGNKLKGKPLQTKINELIAKFKKQGVTDDAKLERLVREELNK